MLPETVAGRPVTELGAYAFSDHIDQRELETAMQKGRFCREDGEPARETEEMPEKRTAVSGSSVRISRRAELPSGRTVIRISST